MDIFLSPELLDLRGRLEIIADQVLAPRAEQVDAACQWPAHAFAALREAGLMGLHVPKRLGGSELGLMALLVSTETLAKACSSSAICYGMHCVAAAVIAAKATPHHEERYLRPIAEGRHITTLALSETATGSHLYIPQTDLQAKEGRFIVNGTKQFITNGGHADSYVISTKSSDPQAGPGDFNCLLLDDGTPGLEWLQPWRGMGMRGNSSRGLAIKNAPIPIENLLGTEGDEIWYIFEVVAPYFLTAMSGTYLGVAAAALEIAVRHLQNREIQVTASALADSDILQVKIAELWAEVQKARLLAYSAAHLGDLGNPSALLPLLSSKAEVADAAIRVTNEVMSLCGGIAYGENSTAARLLRDARASHVMTPTTTLLRLWAGRTLLGRPMF